jgi:hypothetical protein
MSFVADAKATIQKHAKLVTKKMFVGNVNPMAKSATEAKSCIPKNQLRLVLFISTNGLHKGLITHGKYNKLVYSPKSELLKPSLLYIITDTVTTKA